MNDYPKVMIALGANVPSAAGKPAATLNAALGTLGDSGLEIINVSRFYATPCFPAGSGPDYVNAAACLNAEAPPERILHLLHRVEVHYGRRRDQRWGARSLDLDLLAVGDAVLPDRTTFAAWRDLPPDAQRRQAPDRLILPHPRLQDRAFVLVPLAEIAPQWVHPVSRLTVLQMLDALPEAERGAVHPLDD